MPDAAAAAGVIKAGEKEVYFEAEQRLPVTPTGSWGTAGYWAQPPGSSANSGSSGAAVIGSPVGARQQQQQQQQFQQQQQLLRDSGTGEGCVGIWGPEVQEGDPVGIITIEDVIEEVRNVLCCGMLCCAALWRAVLCCSKKNRLCFLGVRAAELHSVLKAPSFLPVAAQFLMSLGLLIPAVLWHAVLCYAVACCVLCSCCSRRSLMRQINTWTTCR
jgi:hypothetical protein